MRSPAIFKRHLLVAIVSDAKTPELKEKTETAIKTAIRVDMKVKVVVCEGQKGVTYDDLGDNVKTIPQPEFKDGLFNYNQCLNECVKATKRYDYVAFCNNDLVFTEGWANRLILEMDKQALESASPICEKRHILRAGMREKIMTTIGEQVGFHFCGWCFVWTRDLYEHLGGLPEDMSFFCADNETMELLKRSRIRHGLVLSSVVTHNEISSTLKTVDESTKKRLTFDQVDKFNAKHGANIFNRAVQQKQLRTWERIMK